MIPIIDAGIRLIEKLIPDKDEQAKMKFKLLELQQKGELEMFGKLADVDVAQAGINEADAESGNWFRAGWRPALAWVCVLGFVYNFLARPILTLYGHPAEALDMSEAITLLGGMLGLTAYRTVEKLKGIK